ncbi:MAG TPA: DUF427 domain-containing protein [Usitatibacter sp.]|nr:DUF427 domain-containing protein [Usitatibacter sp.]
MNPAPGFKQYPGHHVGVRPSSRHVVVKYRGEVIADTREAVELQEDTGEGKKTVAPIVYYIPRKDTRMDRLVKTDHRTHCPFKGDASYFSVKGGDDNAVWSYETPFDETASIKEHLAFYPDKFEIEAS